MSNIDKLENALAKPGMIMTIRSMVVDDIEKMEDDYDLTISQISELGEKYNSPNLLNEILLDSFNLAVVTHHVSIFMVDTSPKAFEYERETTMVDISMLKDVIPRLITDRLCNYEDEHAIEKLLTLVDAVAYDMEHDPFGRY